MEREHLIGLAITITIIGAAMAARAVVELLGARERATHQRGYNTGRAEGWRDARRAAYSEVRDAITVAERDVLRPREVLDL